MKLSEMKKTPIILASGNEGKVRELVRMFDEERIALSTMKSHVPPGFEVEETGTTFEENAWLKAIQVCEKTGLPAIADDSGIEVDALDGRPGVYSARYAGGAGDVANNALLLKELSGVPTEKRTARFRCVLTFAVPTETGAKKIAIASGAVEGRIVETPRGEAGFGYDPLFECFDFPGQTTAEITSDQKNSISHRGKAAALLLPSLKSWLDDQVKPEA